MGFIPVLCTQKHSRTQYESTSLICSWSQVADRTKTPDSGHRDGCCFHLFVDGQPSPHSGLDQTRIQCGMVTSSLLLSKYGIPSSYRFNLISIRIWNDWVAMIQNAFCFGWQSIVFSSPVFVWSGTHIPFSKLLTQKKVHYINQYINLLGTKPFLVCFLYFWHLGS